MVEVLLGLQNLQAHRGEMRFDDGCSIVARALAGLNAGAFCAAAGARPNAKSRRGRLAISA